jgi:hypothetical protein
LEKRKPTNGEKNAMLEKRKRRLSKVQALYEDVHLSPLARKIQKGTMGQKDQTY